MRALILACQDLDQAIFAARQLEGDLDARTDRLIETAMVVASMRPFTGGLLELREYVPDDAADSDLHQLLKRLRDKVYAHTDTEAERRVLFSLGFEAASDSDWIPYGERYTPFPGELLSPVVDLCSRLRDEMYAEAKSVWIELGRPEGSSDRAVRTPVGPRGEKPVD